MVIQDGGEVFKLNFIDNVQRQEGKFSPAQEEKAKPIVDKENVNEIVSRAKLETKK